MIQKGSLVLDIDSNQRARVNWVENNKVGLSYLDEPWYPGHMSKPISSVIPCKDTSSPRRFTDLYERVEAVRVIVTKEKPQVSESMEDALIRLLTE